MASARSVSPGGALLRASRMFSIPNPLTTAAEHRSDTATSDFPTHQVITTLRSSRKQGDWGLKRPLPLNKTTKSGQAMIRIKQIDSPEQVTDYSSSTDLGVTLKKFQEFRLPVTFPVLGPDGMDKKRLGWPGKSVFEHDTTDRDADIAIRWKFQGPWLSNITLGKFNKWLEKHVKPKRGEFHDFLKTKIAAQMLKDLQMEAVDSGEEAPAAVDVASITEDQVTDYLRKLRRDGNYQVLYRTVGEFLDLAPIDPPAVALANLQRGEVLQNSSNPYASSGPPSSHPSGGISYLRTNMYLDNHPVYGPQEVHPPVMARVLKPKRSGMPGGGKIGVAGFVANSPFGDNDQNHRSIEGAPIQHFDPDVEGGTKIWVQPLYVHVTPAGRVKISFGDVHDEATRLVALESLGETKIFGEAHEEEAPKAQAQSIRGRYVYKSNKMSSAENYGINGTRRLLNLK